METLDLSTNIWNRDTAIAYINQLFAAGKEISVAIADLDFFINVDSKVGSSEGDSILRRTAKFLGRVENARVARYGGDEFIIIFSQEKAEQVVLIVDSLRKAFRKEKLISADSIYAKVPITISVGIASTNQHACDTLTLLKAAEIALAMAKKQGRNRVVAAPQTEMTILSDDHANVSTLVGGGLRGYSGDGGRAVTAQILEPYGVDVTPDGQVLVTDRGNHRIRIIRRDGTIETIAGQGTYGYSGDEGPARDAELNKPSGVAIDSQSQVYIADTGNHCLRKIDQRGVIHTLAGHGEDGYCGDGEAAVQAKLSRPGGVVVDGLGRVYTNDYGNNRIRMVTMDGKIQTVAGAGEFGYSGDGGDPRRAALDRPYGLAVTQNGQKLYIADYGNHCIREVDMSEDKITTLCGVGEPGYAGDGGDAKKAMLNGPFWVSTWANNYLLIADGENNRIRICDLRTGIIQTLVGNGQAGYVDGIALDDRIQLNIPAGMAIDEPQSTLYIADYGNNAIRKVALKTRGG